MTSLIQVVLIAVALGVAVAVLSRHGTQSGKAWQKISVLLLMAIMIVAVVSPSIVDRVAHVFGVGRGADLLLYFTVVAFIFFAASSSLHRQTDRDTLHRLARKIAIMDASNKYKDKLK